jgi:SAM-dependent methyltransferase
MDYNSFADSFDKGRALSPAKEALWLNLFKQHLGLDMTSRVLDVGCGTGRFSVLIARQFRCAVVGIDPSLPLLKKAKTKCPREVDWILARSETIPFVDNTFGVCLASQVIHHMENKHQSFSEMYRVLRRGGRLGIRYSSHTQLRAMLEYRFFPSALQIDLERAPDIHEVRDRVRTAGFDSVGEYSVRQPLFESAEDYIEKIRLRYTSGLSLIPEEEYQKGLEEAKVYLRAHELAPSEKSAGITLLIANK